MSDSGETGDSDTAHAGDIGLICAVPDQFSSIWMPRHQLLTRLAARFWTVWLEPPEYWHTDGIRMQRPGVVREETYPKLLTFRNGFLPKVYKPKWLSSALDRRRLALARAALRERGCTRFVLYVWRPQFGHYLDFFDWDLTLYHIDDEYSFSPEEPPISEQENTLLKSVDKVFIHSPGLMEKKGDISPATQWIPNGVDFNAFSARYPEPEDLSRIPSPRIGYVGVLKSQLDFDLLASLADARPNWSFVFVGPRIYLGNQEAYLDALARRPNVYELGMKTPSELPSYIQHMDVAMMCYRVNDYTNYIYPLKLHEYLASGVPVVSTPIRSLMDFQDTVILATGVEEWVTAIETAMSESANSETARQKRKDIAAQFDWDALTQRVATEISEALA
jgi:UDP-galactopyranose mutase